LAEALAQTETDTTAPARTGNRKFESNPEHARGASELQGRIESISGTAIIGWVWDPENPDRRVRLALFDGEICLKTIVAAEDRPDLAQLGCGDGRHGFIIALEQGLLHEGRHTLILRCADTGQKIPGSPIALWRVRTPVSKAQETTSPFRHHFDEVTDSGIFGWIMKPEQPTDRSVVALKHDGQTVAKAVATLFRADLLASGVGDGCYGFELPLPPPPADGRVHTLEIVEEESGASITSGPVQWNPSEAIGATSAPLAGGGSGHGRYPVAARASSTAGRSADRLLDPAKASLPAKRMVAPEVGTHILFDISDLIYYIGHHPNLTGIQRVQSSIILSIFGRNALSSPSIQFLSFDTGTNNWITIPPGFLVSLLRDLLLPAPERLITFDAMSARRGALPGAQQFEGKGLFGDGHPAVLCLLGAAWVQQDYIHRVLALKRRFGVRFVMMVNDLIPIYARDTCDQDTARVFEDFMRRALRHADHILALSENTAADVRRYLSTLRLPERPITVTQTGSSFMEFLPSATQLTGTELRDLPERFVLFVATIEGRKNHLLLFQVWQRLLADDDPPDLVCVGRLGWKATSFIKGLIETDYLNGRVHLLQDVSDFELQELYSKCMFTVFPSLYEGWGLPVSESLAMGKVCVCSSRASIPEVAGDCGVYVDVGDVDATYKAIKNLITDNAERVKLELKIQRQYVPIRWSQVASKVVAACNSAAGERWEYPYPYAAMPCSTEVSFRKLADTTDSMGETEVSRLILDRAGVFTFDLMNDEAFLLGEEIRSRGVWAQPESWGTWLCGTEGEIEFYVARDESTWCYLFARLRVNGWLSDSNVHLVANGTTLWNRPIGEGSRNVMLRVRRRSDRTDWWKLSLGVKIDTTSETLAKICSTDSRMPTVGFENLMIVPERDLSTRLDALTKLSPMFSAEVIHCG
jgi:glycosyltransferase involved in cell wall biosynthesis